MNVPVLNLVLSGAPHYPSAMIKLVQTSEINFLLPSPVSQPLIPLPPPLSLTPRSLLLQRHPFRDVAPCKQQKLLSQSRSEIDPEGGPLRHEGCTCTKVYGGGDGVMLLSLSVVRTFSAAEVIGSGGERSRMYRRAARLPAYRSFLSHGLPPVAQGCSIFLSRLSLNHSSPCPRLSA